MCIYMRFVQNVLSFNQIFDLSYIPHLCMDFFCIKFSQKSVFIFSCLIKNLVPKQKWLFFSV